MKAIFIRSCDKCPFGHFDVYNIIYHCTLIESGYDEKGNYKNQFISCEQVSAGIPDKCPLNDYDPDNIVCWCELTE